MLAGAGRAANTISPNGSYSDTFDASRWLASVSLTGQWQAGNWTISPTASVSYFQSTSEAYLDSLGVDIPSVTGGLGQLALGPNIGYRFDLDNGIALNTTLGLDGVVDISTSRDATTLDLHARLKAGINATMPGGASLALSGGLDGLGGETQIQSVSGNLSLSIPTQ
jgi:outer membrane autotransporter protein